jgi:hypothetical protein
MLAATAPLLGIAEALESRLPSDSWVDDEAPREIMDKALVVKHETVQISSVYGTYTLVDVAMRAPGSRITGYLFAADQPPARGNRAGDSALSNRPSDATLSAT